MNPSLVNQQDDVHVSMGSNCSSPITQKILDNTSNRLTNTNITKMRLGSTISTQQHSPLNFICYNSFQTTTPFQTYTFHSVGMNNCLRKKRIIEKSEMLRVLHLPQTQASVVLGCSISTLKRRFYEMKDDLGISKWPQFYEEIRHLPIFSEVYPLSIEFILNDRMENELTFNNNSLKKLKKTFRNTRLRTSSHNSE